MVAAGHNLLREGQTPTNFLNQRGFRHTLLYVAAFLCALSEIELAHALTFSDIIYRNAAFLWLLCLYSLFLIDYESAGFALGHLVSGDSRKAVATVFG